MSYSYIIITRSYKCICSTYMAKYSAQQCTHITQRHTHKEEGGGGKNKEENILCCTQYVAMCSREGRKQSNFRGAR